MILLDFRDEFKRAYINYLLEEVDVEPLEDFDIVTYTRGAMYFVRGELAKIPRWLAYLLAQEGKVRLLGDEHLDAKKLIAQIISLRYPPLGSEVIDKNIYFKLFELIAREKDPEERERLLKHLMSLVEVRKPKIVGKALSGEETEVLWEDVLIRVLYRCIKEWERTLAERSQKASSI